jgi:AAA15 family ATPase/GTPase
MLFVILFALQNGSLLVFDEFDCKLHPLITAYIIQLFNNPKANTGHGQLIFATHDSNLLSAKCLRRDEVWFVEKDKQEASDLYSLVEFKDADGVKVRNDRSFEKDYIKGRYGAIPYVNYNW